MNDTNIHNFSTHYHFSIQLNSMQSERQSLSRSLFLNTSEL